MSKLLAIIDAYRDTHGQPSDASIARAIGVAPQTLSSWRKRGIRDLPKTETMERLSVFVGVPYRTVLEAALVDAKILPADEVQPEPAAADEDEGRGTG